MFQDGVGRDFLGSQSGFGTTGSSWFWGMGPSLALWPLPSMVSLPNWLVPNLDLWLEPPDLFLGKKGVHFPLQFEKFQGSISIGVAGVT